MATVGVVNVDDLLKRYGSSVGTYSLRVEFPNLKQALKALDEFPRGIRRKWTRIALSAAGGVLRDAAKRLVPQETRLLERSLAVKVKVPRDANRPAYALVGAKRGVRRPVFASAKRFGAVSRKRLRTIGEARAQKLLARGERIRYRSPARYIHLVENPHLLRGGGMTEGSRFLSRTLATAGQAAEAKAISKIREGVQAEAAKVRARAAA